MNEDLGAAIGEMRESAMQLLSSMGQLAKHINWKVAAPALIVGLIAIYGMKNFSIIRSLVASLAIGKIGEEIMSRVSQRMAIAGGDE